MKTNFNRCYRNLEPCPYGEIIPDYTRAFMMMPFRDNLESFYKSNIKITLKNLNIECTRADERFDVPDALCKICKSIQESGILIADMTGRNSNVFCEIGMCFGRGRRVILICQSEEDNPFDTKVIDHIKYDPDNYKQFNPKFIKLVNQAKKDQNLYSDLSHIDSFDDKTSKLFSEVEDIPPLLPNSMSFKIYIGSEKYDENIFPIEEMNSKSLLRAAPGSRWSNGIRTYPNYLNFSLNPENWTPERFITLGSIIKEVKLFPEGQLFAWGEIEPSEPETFDLLLFSVRLFSFILYFYRIMLFQSWKGKIRISIELSDIGRRKLQLTSHDPFSRLEREYNLPQNQDSISYSANGEFIENSEHIINLTNSAVRLGKQVLIYICQSFGFSPEFDFDVYISGILFTLARQPGNFTTSNQIDNITIPRLNINVKDLILPRWAR